MSNASLKSKNTAQVSNPESSLCQLSVAVRKVPVMDLPWVKPHSWVERGWNSSKRSTSTDSLVSVLVSVRSYTYDVGYRKFVSYW